VLNLDGESALEDIHVKAVVDAEGGVHPGILGGGSVRWRVLAAKDILVLVRDLLGQPVWGERHCSLTCLYVHDESLDDEYGHFKSMTIPRCPDVLNSPDRPLLPATLSPRSEHGS